jgi:hypothetical protein
MGSFDCFIVYSRNKVKHIAIQFLYSSMRQNRSPNSGRYQDVIRNGTDEYLIQIVASEHTNGSVTQFKFCISHKSTQLVQFSRNIKVYQHNFVTHFCADAIKSAVKCGVCLPQFIPFRTDSSITETFHNSITKPFMENYKHELW